MIFAWIFTNGNPTQKVDRLWVIMRNGLAGKEGVNEFDKIYKGQTGNTQHKSYDADVANSFYNLASDFYEYGWGDSFHFGFRHKYEGHGVAIKNSQNFVASKLQVKDMDNVLDMGCGVGGPLRGVVRATGANITGLTINEHQIKRAYEITGQLSPWMQQRCHFIKQDYLAIKGMPLEHYDAAFYMESSLHCENRTKTFSEVYKLLKPGGRLVAMEYVTLPGWKPNDPYHQELMRLHLHGNGAARTPSIQEDLAMFKAAGFQIQEHFDYMEWGKNLHGDDAWAWWADLQFNWWPDLLPAHPYVRKVMPHILDVFAKIGLVPADVPKAAHLMNDGGDGLSLLGKEGAITPQYAVIAIKPLKR